MKQLRMTYMLFLLLGSLSLMAQHVTVGGRVTDASTREALQGANIYLPLSKQGQTTNKEGEFKLSVPARKQLELVVSYVGYTSQRFQLYITQDTLLNIKLVQDNQLPDVDIYGSKNDFGVSSSQMSAIELPIAKIRQVPALFGEVDVLKALQKLPGVQSSNDGQAGIYVRGGNYDQNQITLDGSPLYNAEHLKGFVSAINPDMVENVVFYKGAFPARYGGRLSSVVDVAFKDGDMQKYHGALTLGAISSKLHLEGPLWKGRTSFNLGARISYFDAIVQPILENIAENDNAMSPYADVNYYDITAKLVHKFSDKHKLSAFFYKGHDDANSSPTESRKQYEQQSSEYVESTGEFLMCEYDKNRKNGTENDWGNLVGSLSWDFRMNEKWQMDARLHYSDYRSRLKYAADIKEYCYLPMSSANGREIVSGKALQFSYVEDSYSTYHSEIEDASFDFSFLFTPSKSHELRWGGDVSMRRFSPIVDVYKYVHSKGWDKTDRTYTETEELIDTIRGAKQNLKTAAFYMEDDWSMGKYWKANIGLRYSFSSVTGKSYHSLEPRLSLRWQWNKAMSLKVSYSRMAQGVHLLSSSNLVMPSDLWVPVTENIPVMKSDQWGIGYNYETARGIVFSVEGYYKTMDNLLEYREGTSYMTAEAGWEELVAQGKGRTYGVELLLQKNIGKTTGWVSYTWSKTLRTFDRPGQELNGGREFYAGNDRRHNVNVLLAHRFNKHWDTSLSWTFQSGRRGTLSYVAFLGGHPEEYSQRSYFPRIELTYLYNGEKTLAADLPIYFNRFTYMQTYGDRNNFRLPDIHRLDVSVNYTLLHRRCKSIFNLSANNVYNRQNVSNVYIGYDNNKTVLKGICLLPIMPSISYTLQF